MAMSIFEWTSLLLAPLTGVASWLAATRLRQNRTIREMQQTILNLVEENKRVYAELTEARREIAGYRLRLHSSISKTLN